MHRVDIHFPCERARLSLSVSSVMDRGHVLGARRLQLVTVLILLVGNAPDAAILCRIHQLQITDGYMCLLRV